MSWPVRASLFRTRTLAEWIEDWLTYGDPPYLGGIGSRCNNLREVEPRGHLLQISAPAVIATSHHRLIEAYSAVRVGCIDARRRALEARAALYHNYNTRRPADKRASDRALAFAHRDLSAFAHVTLRSFDRRVLAWRSAVVSEAAALSVPLPSWLTQL